MIAASRPLLAVACGALLLLSVGCASQTVTAKVLISEGCVVMIEGISTRQADEILRTWDVDPNCRVEVRSTTGEE